MENYTHIDSLPLQILLLITVNQISARPQAHKITLVFKLIFKRVIMKKEKKDNSIYLFVTHNTVATYALDDYAQ